MQAQLREHFKELFFFIIYFCISLLRSLCYPRIWREGNLLVAPIVSLVLFGHPRADQLLCYNIQTRTRKIYVSSEQTTHKRKVLVNQRQHFMITLTCLRNKKLLRTCDKHSSSIRPIFIIMYNIQSTYPEISIIILDHKGEKTN